MKLYSFFIHSCACVRIEDVCGRRKKSEKCNRILKLFGCHRRHHSQESPKNVAATYTNEVRTNSCYWLLEMPRWGHMNTQRRRLSQKTPNVLRAFFFPFIHFQCYFKYAGKHTSYTQHGRQVNTQEFAYLIFHPSALSLLGMIVFVWMMHWSPSSIAWRQ